MRKPTKLNNISLMKFKKVNAKLILMCTKMKRMTALNNMIYRT